MSDKLFQRAIGEWLEDGSDRTPGPAIDAVLLAVQTTPQERDLRIPWRFPLMSALTRTTGIAAVVLVAVVGASALIYLSSRTPIGPGTPTAPPTTTQAPTTAATGAPVPTASQVAPGISAWTNYTSAVHGFTMSYPADWSVNAPASRTWQAGDEPYEGVGGVWPFADTFASPGAEIGLWVWEMPAGEGADVESVPGLKAFAEKYCTDVGASSCDVFTQQAVPMCLDAGGDSCRAALLVPGAGDQYAFFVDWSSALLTTVPDRVTVIYLGREDSFPAAAQYGGAVELLKSILTTMDVFTPGPGQDPNHS